MLWDSSFLDKVSGSGAKRVSLTLNKGRVSRPRTNVKMVRLNASQFYFVSACTGTVLEAKYFSDPKCITLALEDISPCASKEYKVVQINVRDFIKLITAEPAHSVLRQEYI